MAVAAMRTLLLYESPQGVLFACSGDNSCAFLQVLHASEQCRSELQAFVQHCLGLFAQPILDRIARQPGSDFGNKYGSNYSVTQDTFLYDHVKV